MNKNIALIYGDCSSPEIVTQAVRVLDKIAAKHGHTFSYTRAYMGGEAIDKFGDPLPISGVLRARSPLTLCDISPHCGESPTQRGPFAISRRFYAKQQNRTPRLY